MFTAAQRKEHILNRVGYGPTTWGTQRYDEIGHTEFIQEQLDQTLPAIVDQGVFIQSKIERSVRSQRQLETVLLDFWFNHFNVDAKDDTPASRLSVIGGALNEYQNVAIGSHVLGNFSDMLIATAKSPSMAVYLDNAQNRKPGIAADGTPIGYNENYAREVMELHTVGIDGGYSQADVQEATRILTGWVYTRPRDPDWYSSFRFLAAHHDTGSKTVMGVDYPADVGVAEGEALLNYLANHPATASRLSYKLCERFVGDNPPAEAVSAASTMFGATGGDLGAVMSTILSLPSFVEPDDVHFRSKVKPPHRYVASALAGMGMTAQPVQQWNELAPQLKDGIIAAGETPYYLATPTGYPEAATYWLSTASILARFDVARTIAYNDPLLDALIARAQVDGSDISALVDAVETTLVPGGVSDDTKTAVLQYIADPDFTNRQRVAATAYMLFCSPEFMRY